MLKCITQQNKYPLFAHQFYQWEAREKNGDRVQKAKKHVFSLIFFFLMLHRKFGFFTLSWWRMLVIQKLKPHHRHYHINWNWGKIMYICSNLCWWSSSSSHDYSGRFVGVLYGFLEGKKEEKMVSGKNRKAVPVQLESVTKWIRRWYTKFNINRANKVDPKENRE